MITSSLLCTQQSTPKHQNLGEGPHIFLIPIPSNPTWQICKSGWMPFLWRASSTSCPFVWTPFIINTDLILARLDTNAILFMRTPKNSDSNLLDAVVWCGNFYSYISGTYLFFVQKGTKGSSLKPGVNDAIVTISTYTRVPWGPSYVNRSSQHAFLSSQCLQDIYGAIPCTSNNLPQEAGDLGDRLSCVICIEGFAYGSGIEGHDYSE